MPFGKVYQRIHLMRQTVNKLGVGGPPRSRSLEEQGREKLSLPLGKEVAADGLARSFPGVNIDEFPTSPMPLYTIDSWPTQPLPVVKEQMSLLAAPVEAGYLAGDELVTLTPGPLEASGAEVSGKAQSATSAASYVGLARTMVKSSGIYALASLVSPMISLVLAPFLTHHLSLSDYGILTVLTTVITLAAGITQLGLGSAFFRVYNYEYTEPHDRRAVLGTVSALLCLLSLPVAIAASLASPALTLVLPGRPSADVITLAAWIVVVQNLAIPGFAWLRAENRPLLYSLLSISNVVIVLCVNLVLLGLLHWGIAGSLLATGMGYGSVVACTLPIVLWRSRLRVRKEVAWSLATFGAPLVLSSISYWVLQVSDRYLLGWLGSVAQVASYAVAYSLGSVLATLVIAPFALAWPATMFSVAKQKDAPHVFQLIFRWFSTLLLFVAFAISIGGSLLLGWLFPKSYHSAAPIIPVVAESIVFYGLYSVFMTGASVQRKTWMHALFTAVAALVNFGLNLVLIPRYGSGGAAASTLIAYIVLAMLGYLANQRIYPVPYEMRRFWFALLSGVALYVGADVFSVGWGTFWRWTLTFVCLVLYGALLLFLVGGIGFLRTYGARFRTRISVDRRAA